MSTYIPSFKHERMKQSSSPESPIPIENLIMYIPSNGGIHDSDVPRVGGNGVGLLRDCGSHEMLSIGQTESRIPPSGFPFHSDHGQCENVLVGFPSLVYENMQDSKSCLQGIGNVVSDSKYLKPTQNLLDDVVNVKKALQQHSKHESNNNSKEAFTEWRYKRDSIPISASEKKDLHKKVTKLSSMLNEVDRKYKEYYNEMEIVISSFDGVAGYGAAIPYTTLTLQTISRKFRFLKDAIKTQIQVMSRRLGNTDSNEDGIGIPRLKFVDQQVRQQSRVQHIWRPQRGLPECSVSVLRAWLFEHFLHPYPKDSDKMMLARQTGLTRSQVANWFINARVRLWKPMIEEMHKEESGMDSNSSSEIPPT